MSKIYTRTGDKGKTGLANGKRILKSDLRIEVLGTIDELNSVIGVVLAELRINDKGLMIREELVRIQNDLLEIGSALANPQGVALQSLKKRVKDLEGSINQMTAQMPPLKNFILPGGGKTGAMLHLARAVCRRAERRIIELNNKQKVDAGIIIYFNRLSDLLFTLARFANFREKRKEQIWVKTKT